MLKIIIKDLRLFGYHGVLEDEKKHGQEFLYNALIEIDHGDFKANDDLSQTVNYSEIIALIKEINMGNKFDLLETLCQVTAEKIIAKSARIKKVSLRIEKTSPPIKENLQSVGIEYSLEKSSEKIAQYEKVYLSLGSNIGQKANNLMEAVNRIGKNPFLNIQKISSIYRTEPMYVRDQDEFLNLALEAQVDSIYSPFNLMGFLKGIEYEMGRKSTSIRYGPRIIDIDIIFYGNRKIKSDFLTIPHPGLKERNFVLVPLAEIAPELMIEKFAIKEFIKKERLQEKINRL